MHSDTAIYVASKKFAELAVWEWAEAHPDVDVTTSKSSTIVLPHIWLTKGAVVYPQTSPSAVPLRSFPAGTSSTSEA